MDTNIYDILTNLMFLY